MSIYIIGDLHLGLSVDKPMNVFGDNWDNHAEKIKKDWISKVNDDDLVILAGDFSWGTYLKDTYDDFKFLSELPGKKLMLKGNHDYWWTTITSMKNYLKENNFENIDFVYNNAYIYENIIITGTRGWTYNDTSVNSAKMINREKQRLELSIKDGINKYGDDKEIITIMHYPPITTTNCNNIYNMEFINLMKKYDIKKCYYAHLHGTSHKDAIEGVYFDIDFKLISADYLDFKLHKIQ